MTDPSERKKRIKKFEDAQKIGMFPIPELNWLISQIRELEAELKKEIEESMEVTAYHNELVRKIVAENKAYREAIDTPPEELARKMFGECWNSLPVDYKNEQVAFYRKLQVALRALDELRKVEELGKGGGE